MTTPTKCTLAPGEHCEWCGAVGETRKPARPKPLCPNCQQPFKKGEKWRLLRGKRIHNPCPSKP